LTFSGGYIKK